MLTTLSASLGFGEVAISLNLFYLLMLIPLMVIVSMAGSFIPGRQAAALAIINVLRRE
jgi:ABC-type lipoprotein release transport system permease subunit